MLTGLLRKIRKKPDEKTLVVANFTDYLIDSHGVYQDVSPRKDINEDERTCIAGTSLQNYLTNPQTKKLNPLQYYGDLVTIAQRYVEYGPEKISHPAFLPQRKE